MIVLTLLGDAADLRAEIRRADPRAELLELRLDRIRGDDLPGLAEEMRSDGRPWIASCRRSVDGGLREGSEEERIDLLRAAAASGAARIDLEAGTPALLLRDELSPGRILLSRHEDGFPGPAERHLAELRSLAPPPAWVKYVPTASRATDLLRVRELLLRSGEGTILFAMGGPGRASRALALAWGSAATYASPDHAPQAAPGQPTISQLLDEWCARELRRSTPLTGVAGRPLGHSLSPLLHNAAHRALGRPERMLPVEAADAEDLLALAAELPLCGLAVTLPFKREMAARCAHLGAEARACASVNTLLSSAGGWRGESTDGPGFLDSLAGLPLPPRFRAAVLGSGGAAAAVAAALSARGCDLRLYSRDRQASAVLARSLGVSARPWAEAGEGEAELLVNATPSGMLDPEESPLELAGLAGYRVVVDLVYRARETRLVREAREAGLVARDGRAMLVAQAERQYELLHGRRPPPGLMEAAAAEGLRRRERPVAPGRGGG